ncbi:hypothetical protein TSA66_23230 [Noviherbaspirillum autotrophicum]|uniref:Uncharacterized protein n=1 Tax=Noviherbaspirillum autotrophicum TaxID=709839 RepID=A0A0C1Y860_9BURK|nr:hypothetical protein TSA66_23230 [Noviherbaspirillum autotrophicum]
MTASLLLAGWEMRQGANVRIGAERLGGAPCGRKNSLRDRQAAMPHAKTVLANAFHGPLPA